MTPNALDLRQFVAWCQSHGLRVFDVRRADIECFALHLEELGRARATVARRLSTVAGFYRYAEQDGLLDRSPAVHVRRRRLDYECHATGLDRNEIGALLVVAGLGRPAEHALVSLLAINGLRVGGALGANIEALGLERGHRTLTVARNGGKIVTIPLAPRTARAIDLSVGERLDGPIFLDASGERLDRRPAPPEPSTSPSASGPKNRSFLDASGDRLDRHLADRDRTPSLPPGRDQQACQTPHPPPRVHQRRPRRRLTTV